MLKFTNKDVEDYYDQTEVHYRIHWNLEQSLGLHYGIWEADTKSVPEAVINTNRRLMKLGEIAKGMHGLDAGCGVGGSSIFLARQLGCTMHGITLSKKQSETATGYAQKAGVGELCTFSQQDYTQTNFADNTFDFVWSIESMETAPDKSKYFKEMYRVLKPGGKILIADIFKPYEYDIANEKEMQTMLNGWAITDILSIEGLKTTATANGLSIHKLEDVSPEVEKSVEKIYQACVWGRIGTKLYNLFKDASPFSKIHHRLSAKTYLLREKMGLLLSRLPKT